MVMRRSFGGVGKQARFRQFPQTSSKIIMHAQSGVFMIVEAGAAQLPVVKFEAERADQMQLRTGVGAQADHVACVRRNLGLVKNDVEHWSCQQYKKRISFL